MLRAIRLIHKIKKAGPKDVAQLLEDYFEESAITIAKSKINGKHIVGIDSDITYESMKSGIAREPHFERIVNALLNQDDNCLDLGANHGTHSLVMAKACFKGKVFAFEPQSLVSQILALNIYLNQNANIVLFNLAVSAKTGDIVKLEQIVTSVKDINSGWTRVTTRPSLHKAITVAVDDLKLPRISFIKMDIQGSEFLALKGMKRILTKDRPYLFFECEEVHLSFVGSDKYELFNEIRDNNYAIYRIETEYPSDHLAVPIEKINELEALIQAKSIGTTISRLDLKCVE